MYKKVLLLTIFACNALHGMENGQNPLDLQVTRYNELLQQDLTHSSNAIETLTTGWPDSKRCLYGSLAGVGLGAIGCVIPKELGQKLFCMGATIFIGNATLSLAAMHNEARKKDIYIEDKTTVNQSIKELTQIISKITQINTGTQFQQLSTTTSETKPVNDKKLELIDTCNKNYATTLETIKKITAEYPTSKICFYTTMGGILLLAFAWLSGDKNSGKLAGMGSVLFLGAGAIGLLSALNEEQTLKGCIHNKASARNSIMDINRS